MSKSKRAQNIDKLARSTSIVGINELIELLNSPKRLGWLRFYGGLMAGAGGVLGAAVILVLLGFIAQHTGGLPWINHIFRQISNAAQSK